MRFELFGAAEQFGSARTAGVNAFRGGVGVLADERAFGAGLAQDGELLRSQLFAPLALGVRDLRCAFDAIV
ncbi:hypothetical protein N806_17545 [Rhodococcus sp. P27]|nr:hypothetical protein N806_17545 [Rhodococcus sp. P27]